MSDEVTFKISIPSDEDGYILLQCQHCGSFFKCTVGDLEDDSVLNINCPRCGLISENYLTKDVIDLAQAKMENYALDYIYDSFKNMERQFSSNSMVSFKAGKKPEHEYEKPIRSIIDNLVVNHYK